MDFIDYTHCTLCPRQCGADRTVQCGVCGANTVIHVARAALHYWEEPCISGEGPGAPGSGTVFFTGCALHCCFCQNYKISEQPTGKAVSEQQLADIFLQLQAAGAANINLVTASHYLPGVLQALQLAQPALKIPVAYNCGGYETVASVEALAGNVDIFMPDLKYYDSALSAKLSRAPDYFTVASKAITRMVQLAGPPVFGPGGLLRRGVIVRHLVLPGHRKDSLQLLQWLAENLPKDSFILSLMSQYTPYRKLPFQELNRRLSSFEYNTVVNAALDLGFTHAYTQQRTAAKEEYTPDFDLTGL